MRNRPTPPFPFPFHPTRATLSPSRGTPSAGPSGSPLGGKPSRPFAAKPRRPPPHSTKPIRGAGESSESVGSSALSTPSTAQSHEIAMPRTRSLDDETLTSFLGASHHLPSKEEFLDLERRACEGLNRIFLQGRTDSVAWTSSDPCIQILKAYQRACHERAMYQRADLIQQVLRRLRLDAESHHMNELTKAQMKDRAALEESYRQDFRAFHQVWNARIEEFDRETMEQEMNLVRHQNEKMIEFQDEMRSTSPRLLRYSRSLIESRMRQQALARQKDYICAAEEKRKADVLDAQDLKRFEESKAAVYAHREETLRHHQNQELYALRKRIESRRLFLERGRQQELEVLLRKYINARNEMENYQGIVRSKADMMLLKHSGNMRLDGNGNAAFFWSAGPGAHRVAIKQRFEQGPRPATSKIDQYDA